MIYWDWHICKHELEIFKTLKLKICIFIKTKFKIFIDHSDSYVIVKDKSIHLSNYTNILRDIVLYFFLLVNFKLCEMVLLCTSG